MEVNRQVRPGRRKSDPCYSRGPPRLPREGEFKTWWKAVKDDPLPPRLHWLSHIRVPLVQYLREHGLPHATSHEPGKVWPNRYAGEPPLRVPDWAVRFTWARRTWEVTRSGGRRQS